MEDKNYMPPKWADQFLVWFVDENLIEEIQGDLHEAHRHRVKKYGRTIADRRFISDVFKFFKPFAFEKYSRVKQFLPMYNNYFKIAFRNILHRKGFTAINLLGLTIGISAVMLIGLFLNNELTYDQKTPSHERIHRIMNNFRDQTYTCMPFNGYYGASMDTQLMLINLLESFDEVETACHFVPTNSAIGGDGQFYLKTGDKKIVVENILFTNTGNKFNEIFPQKFLAGSPEYAFSDFNKIILTKKIANRVYGEYTNMEELMGSELTISEEKFELAGIIADVPSNMHYEFDFIIHQDKIPSWGAYTYTKLNENASINTLLKNLEDNIERYNPGFIENELWKGFTSVPLTDIHFTSDTLYELKPIGNKSYLSTFGIVGLIILLIIWTNYTNLSIAMYADRQKELGMRKVMGARSQDISFQLLVEAILLAMLCFPLILLTLNFILPNFNKLMELDLELHSISTWPFLLSLFILLLFTGILSSIYPALNYGGRSMLKLFGKNLSFTPSNRFFNFRNSLVTVQFAMVVGLLSITYFIYQQMDYVNKIDLGFEKEGVIYFGIDGVEKHKQLKSKLLNMPEVEAVGANGVPGSHMFNQLTYKMKDTDVTLTDGTQQEISLGTIQALGISCDACRQLENGKEQIFVINKTAAEKLAKIKDVTIEELIGETLVMEPEWENEEYGYGIHQTIDGIIDDYKYFSLKHPNQSLITTIYAEAPWAYETVVKVKTDDWYATNRKIKKAYTEIEKVQPFEMLFLEDRLQKLYTDEKRSSNLLIALSLIAIVLALLGLAGIVSYVAYSRQKEIGIRKVLGASVESILLGFNREYLILMGVATLVALPLAIYFSQKWLTSFAYQIEPKFWVVLLSGLAALVLVMLVVTIQARQAAFKDPVETLRMD